MVKGFKVITAEESARIEKIACQEGCKAIDFMMQAGRGIADMTERFVTQRGLEKKVTLLVGKGNNGGDALFAGSFLLKLGYRVLALHPYTLSESTPLCQTAAKQFLEAGGKIEKSTPLEGVILDGLLGTGFQGKLEGVLAEIIEKANTSHLPILAIDIPSGLNGNNGEVSSIAIKAKKTFFLGLPKLGFFINEGWNHVGELIAVDFGLPSKYLDQAHAEALLPFEASLKQLLPPIKRTRHKYEAGYLLAIAGSKGMTGAAILACYAALRSGTGIVRLLHPEEISSDLNSAPWEIIKTTFSFDYLLPELKRAQSLLIGPGMGRSEATKKLLLSLLPQLTLPHVIDADALYFLREIPNWTPPANTLLTPHRKEMETLIENQPTLSHCQDFVDQKKVTLVLKGAPTFIFHPQSLPLIMIQGDPGMATAGSGDVLTGIAASLMAQKLTSYQAAALAVYLHGCAGEQAALHKSSYGMIASDIIENLPDSLLKCDLLF